MSDFENEVENQDEIFVGKIIRLIILNNRRHRPTERREIMSTFNLSRPRYEEVVQVCKEKVNKLGLEIISVDLFDKEKIVEKEREKKENSEREKTPDRHKSENERLFIIKNKMFQTLISKQLGGEDTTDSYRGFFSQKAIPPVPLEKKQLFTIFAMCEADNDEFNNIEALRDCKIFKSFKVEDVLARVKREGYVKTTTKDNIVSYSRAWRYYVEYGEFFNMTEFFKLSL